MPRLWAVLCAGLLAAACIPEVAPGEWGTMRYFAQMRGEAPMRLIPPYTDRNGRVYVLFGDDEGSLPTTVYTGQTSGGWSGGCTADRGVGGVRGFIGRDLDRVWYWSARTLVSVDGDTGACREVLTRDPVTQTEISWQGIVPLVDNTPSRTRVVAMVQGATDARPTTVLVDLDQRLYSIIQSYQPADATDVVVLGTGANPIDRTGVFVTAHQENGATKFQAIFVQRDGQWGQVLPLNLDEAYARHGAIEGFIQSGEEGHWAGVLDDGTVLYLNANSGRTEAVDSWDVYGIHRRDGALFAVGVRQDQAMIAPISPDGRIDNPTIWASSVAAEGALTGSFAIRDERTSPTRRLDWADVRNVIGPHPFVTPYPIDAYTIHSAGWLVGGPVVQAGVEPQTSIAFAPVGISWP